MDEARNLLQRLERVAALDRRDAPAGELLSELRCLVREAEAWVRAEREPAAAVEAVTGCREALAAHEQEVVPLAS